MKSFLEELDTERTIIQQSIQVSLLLTNRKKSCNDFSWREKMQEKPYNGWAFPHI